ncbi:MAG: hypothetical protein M1820_010518 [Bogoriella megaspora]|nr:MAG: hypothetical protein M1820_010518 [Bogoriella megaspora]
MDTASKRKASPPELTEARNVRLRRSTTPRETSFTINYEDHLTEKIKILIYVPADTGFFKESLAQVLKLYSADQADDEVFVDEALVEEIIKKVEENGADTTKCVAIRELLQPEVDKSKGRATIRQIGKKLAELQVGKSKTDLQPLKNSIYDLVDGYIGAFEPATLPARQKLFMMLDLEESGKSSMEISRQPEGSQKISPAANETGSPEIFKKPPITPKPLTTPVIESSANDISPKPGLGAFSLKRKATNGLAEQSKISSPFGNIKQNGKSGASSKAEQDSSVKQQPKPDTKDIIADQVAKEQPTGDDTVKEGTELSIRGAGQNEGNQKTHASEQATTKEPMKLNTKISVDQLIAQEGKPNTLTRNNTIGLPTPRSAEDIRGKPSDILPTKSHDNLFDSLEQGLEKAARASNKAQIKSEDSPQSSRVADFAASYMSTSPAGPSPSKLMTCYYWYNNGHCNKSDEECSYAHRHTLQVANPRGAPIANPHYKPSTRSLESRIERPESQPHSALPGDTPIVDVLWDKYRATSFDNRHDVINTIKKNVLRRASPDDFVTQVEDNQGRLSSYSLRGNADMFGTKLGGLFGGGNQNQPGKIRFLLEDVLLPFVLANRTKFIDIPGLDLVEQRTKHNQPIDSYRPVEERRSISDLRSAPMLSDYPARQRASTPAPAPKAYVKGMRCSKCGRDGHESQYCHKDVVCSYCHKLGHPDWKCKFKSGEWPLPNY